MMPLRDTIFFPGKTITFEYDVERFLEKFEKYYGAMYLNGYFGHIWPKCIAIILKVSVLSYWKKWKVCCPNSIKPLYTLHWFLLDDSDVFYLSYSKQWCSSWSQCHRCCLCTAVGQLCRQWDSPSHLHVGLSMHGNYAIQQTGTNKVHYIC